MSNGFPCHLAAVLQFPRGTGEVLSDYFVFSVMQLRAGCLKRPAELAIRRLTDIDLRSGRMREQHNFFARRRLNRIRNVGPNLFLGRIRSLCRCSRGSKHDDAESNDRSSN